MKSWELVSHLITCIAITGNYQESTTILNACTKMSGNLLNSPRIWIFLSNTHYSILYRFLLSKTRLGDLVLRHINRSWLSRIPLQMYEIAISRVERIQRYSNKYLRKWLGVPPCFSKVGLHTNSGNLHLPISSLVEEFKIRKVSLHMKMKDSADEIIRKVYPVIKSGAKWSAAQRHHRRHSNQSMWTGLHVQKGILQSEPER